LPLGAMYSSVEADLIKVENLLKTAGEVDSQHVAKLLSYSLKGVGKRIRPALTLLCGQLYKYNLDSLLPMAASVELMHTATLVHDDAIDNSMVRRGRSTVNSIWGEEKAILLGDYLFAKAGDLCTDTGNLGVVKLFTQTLETISAGEIDQSFGAFNLDQTYDDYIRRISGKTASLFALATESGAILSKSPPEAVTSLRDYGFNMGIAFQIIDDILDYISTEEEMGKPIGSDLVQGTLTLPAMLLLQKYPDDNPVKRLFQNKDEADRPRDVARAIAMVRNSEIVQECYQVASDYSSRACSGLNILPDIPTRKALIELAMYVIRRRK